MKRCHGKLKLRDAGDAARHVWPGYSMGLYRCKECGFYHLTKSSRLSKSGRVAW